MTQHLHVPILVVGAGPVGLAAANLLGQEGIGTLVLERNAQTVNHPRAIVLDDEGARTLQAFGADAYLADTIEGDGARYYDDAGECFGVVGAGPRTYGFAKRHFMYQPELERALVDNLARFPAADLRFGWEVTGIAPDAQGVTVSCRSPDGPVTIRCDWLLACDGGRSPVRERLGIGFAGSTYAQDWIVLDLSDDDDRANYTRFFCSTARPSVSVPAPRGGRRYEFMLHDGEAADEMLTDAALARLLTPHRSFEPAQVLRRAVYRFHARIADRLRSGRVLLLGDAAHLTPPFAGQGMNAGLRDAHNVAWKLAAVLRGFATEAILDSYDEERRDPAWSMIQLAVAMGQIVMPKGEEQAALRAMLLKMLEAFPGARDYFLQMKFKPKPRYASGLFVDIDAQPYPASLVGEMLPQPEVTAREGRCKLDALLGSGFALIAQHAAGAETLRHLTHPLWRKLAPARVYLNAAPGVEDASVIAATPLDALHQPLLAHRDQVLLVRPDRYVAGAFDANDEAGFAARFEAVLNPTAAARLSA